MAKEVLREIGNKSREFFEFVSPPIDMIFEENNLVITIDLAGFDKKDIKLKINGNILSINAKRDLTYDGTIVWQQRPHQIDKKIILPINVKEGEDIVGSAKYIHGVLTLIIPIKTGKDISIE